MRASPDAQALQPRVLQVLDEALALGGRAQAFHAGTPLLGALPELDSMGMATLLGALEDRLGIEVADDDVQAADFESVGSLVAFVWRQHGGRG